MLAQLVLATVLLFAGKDPAVVGAWGMGGATLFSINADGTGDMEGEPFTWSTDKGVITIVSDGETEKVGYAVKNGKLVVAMDGMPITLDKLGGGAVAPPPAAPAGKPAKAAAPAKAGKDELSQLLMKNAWCSFSYNKNSGYSSKSRAVFFANGTFSMNAQGEGYSSGYGGSMASQHNTGDSGEWKTVNGQLHIKNADTGNQWMQQQLEITRNSNGSPILKSGGKEYMVCQ